jgi:hypothetical protein
MPISSRPFIPKRRVELGLPCITISNDSRSKLIATRVLLHPAFSSGEPVITGFQSTHPHRHPRTALPGYPFVDSPLALFAFRQVHRPHTYPKSSVIKVPDRPLPVPFRGAAAMGSSTTKQPGHRIKTHAQVTPTRHHRNPQQRPAPSLIGPSTPPSYVRLTTDSPPTTPASPYTRGAFIYAPCRLHHALSLAPISALFTRYPWIEKQPPQRPDTNSRPASMLPVLFIAIPPARNPLSQRAPSIESCSCPPEHQPRTHS